MPFREVTASFVLSPPAPAKRTSAPLAGEVLPAQFAPSLQTPEFVVQVKVDEGTKDVVYSSERPLPLVMTLNVPFSRFWKADVSTENMLVENASPRRLPLYDTKALVQLAFAFQLIELPAVLVEDMETRLTAKGEPMLVSVRSPEMERRSQPVPADPVQLYISSWNAPPPLKVVLPALNVPTLLPGASVPLTDSAPTWPEPPNAPPLDTVTALEAFAPFMTSFPPLTVVAPS